MGVTLALPTLGASMFVVAGGYATLFVKVRRDAKRKGMEEERANVFAAFATLGKVPQAVGQAKYWWARLRKQRSRLIEYKRP
jgi:hypothetical protein